MSEPKRILVPLDLSPLGEAKLPVAEAKANLIVLGASVRAGLPRAFLGSVADEVVRQAPCPVLLVQPQLEAGVATPIRSFAEDAARMGPLAQRTLGLRTVEVARIIGSVGRASSLGPSFR